MNNMCQLSNNTRAYIEQYECTLMEMINNMSCAVLTDSISGSFITQMIPHHCAAIAMSENLLRYTTNIPLQNIALNIIKCQKKSIENMRCVYPKCQCCKNCPQELFRYKKKNNCILNNMFCEMKSACTDNNIDANFIREMIPHHKGAVCMSKNALCFTLCPELIPILESIIISQEEGICQMNQLLEQIECCK